MDILFLGNALVDGFARVHRNFPERFGLKPGSANHVDEGRIREILAALPSPALCAGGGAANAAKAAASLGLGVGFRGCVGRDDFGSLFLKDLSRYRIGANLETIEKPTGIFLTLDEGGRGKTLVASPGASLSLGIASLESGLSEKPKLVYLEGFLAFSQEFFAEALAKIEESGTPLALDAGSAGVIRERRSLVSDAAGRCAFLFANEEEMEELFPLAGQGWDGKLIRGEAVMKQGKRGATAFFGGKPLFRPARPAKALDATGAGDCFAGAYLAGALRGFAISERLELGNRIGSEMVRIRGTGIEPERIRKAAGDLWCASS